MTDMYHTGPSIKEVEKAMADAYEAIYGQPGFETPLAAMRHALAVAANGGFVLAPTRPTQNMTLAWAKNPGAFQGTSASHAHAADVWRCMIGAVSLNVPSSQDDTQ